MIKIFSGKNEKMSVNRLVYDLETTTSGLLLMCGYSWNGVDCQFSSNLRDLLGITVMLADETKDNYVEIWAHNGFRFDHLFLMKEIYGDIESLNGVFEHGNILSLRFKYKGVNVSLKDSYAVTQSSLAKVTKHFCKKYLKLTDLVDYSGGKTPEWLYYNDVVKFFEYLRFDVLSTYELIEELQLLIYQLSPRYFKLPGTVGSLAMYFFRANLKRDIMTPPLKLDAYERLSYFGGLCGCRRTGIFNRVVGFDVNSMYPFQMYGRLFPVDYAGYWTLEFDSGKLGLWTVDYDTFEDLFIFDCNERCLSSKGEAIVDTDTVLYLTQYYKCSVIRGYVYLHTSKNLFDYFEGLYELKKLGGAKGVMAKYILNSSYGKFGQKHERCLIGQLTKEELFDKIRQEIPVHEYNFGDEPLYSWSEFGISPYTFVAIASLVTLRSRLYLWKMIKKLELSGYSVVYYDTDCIHFVVEDERDNNFKNLFRIHDKDLGCWKLEFDGEAGYAGKKLYYYRKNSKAVVKAKGVTNFTLEALKKVIHEGVCEGESVSVTTPRQVLKGGQPPGVFSKITKNISKMSV